MTAGIFNSAIFNFPVFNIGDGGASDTHDGGWIDYHRRKSEQQRKKLKKHYVRIKSDPVIAQIIAPYVETPQEQSQLPQYESIDLALLYQNQEAIAQLLAAIESRMFREALARQKIAEDDDLLMTIAHFI